MWKDSPQKIYKWIRGTVAVWDLAVHDEDGFAYTPDDMAKRPGTPQLQKQGGGKASEGTSHTLRSVIKHCPSGKARGADRRGMSEIKLLPEQAVRDLVVFLKCVEVMVSWPPALQEMLTSSFPKKERRTLGREGLLHCFRKSIGCGQLVVELMCLSGDSFAKTEETLLSGKHTAAGQHQAGVFLDCSKCYERVPLSMLEQFAIESGYPLYALNVALD
eukprot:2923579-Amphidinium_carterae.1